MPELISYPFACNKCGNVIQVRVSAVDASPAEPEESAPSASTNTTQPAIALLEVEKMLYRFQKCHLSPSVIIDIVHALKSVAQQQAGA